MSLLEEPMHPGEVLKELYLNPLGMGAIAFARHLDLPRTRIERLVKGITGITPDTALRLARAFSTTPAYWMNMQANYDIFAMSKKVDVSGIEPLSHLEDDGDETPQEVAIEESKSMRERHLSGLSFGRRTEP